MPHQSITVAAAPYPFTIGYQVRHRPLSEGSVTHYDGDTLVILFDDGDYRALLLPHVLEGQLFEPLASWPPASSTLSLSSPNRGNHVVG